MRREDRVSSDQDAAGAADLLSQTEPVHVTLWERTRANKTAYKSYKDLRMPNNYGCRAMSRDRQQSTIGKLSKQNLPRQAVHHDKSRHPLKIPSRDLCPRLEADFLKACF